MPKEDAKEGAKIKMNHEQPTIHNEEESTSIQPKRFVPGKSFLNPTLNISPNTNMFSSAAFLLPLVLGTTFTTYTQAQDVSILPRPSSTTQQLVAPWNGQTTRDLHREYSNIFKFGNRNAASHRWSTFLLDRAPNSFTLQTLTYMFTGFCAVSGSPITPSDFNRYGLELDSLTNDASDKMFGFMHYCCWPCVCDTQDFIKVDTKNITFADGATHQLHFAVIGNPCDHPEALEKPFVQPFDRRTTTLAREAAEVRCNADGSLEGATMSDHGYVIISMFFDAVPVDNGDGQSVTTSIAGQETPGRVQETARGVKYQSEKEYAGMCTNRANNGYNSGMGEIFRKVAAISAIDTKRGSDDARERGERLVDGEGHRREL